MAFQRRRFLTEVLLLTICVLVSAYVIQGKHTKKKIAISIAGKLKFLHRPALKSIQSPDGDIIDCVDIYRQPAFDHPTLLNHTIQMKPSYIPGVYSVDGKNTSSTRMAPQIWQRSGSCPKGFIPIRRVRKQELLRFNDLESFGRKSRTLPNASNKRQTLSNRTLVINNTTVFLDYQPNHSSAVLVATVTHFVGSRGSLNTWNPRVESPDEYTTSQIWLTSGGPNDYESVESGWIVNPKLYGDSQTRFFTHWTSDGYQKTGCFDLLCSGFVQTSHEVALGAALSPVSSADGSQYEISVQISMDAKTGNWWLRISDTIDLGYWPNSLFGDYLKSGATVAQWGGEVHSTKVRGVPHTKTALGSGHWPQDLFGNACYIAHIRTMDYSYVWNYPRYVGILTDEPDCYAAFHYVPGFMEEPTLFFGGPGGFQNPTCP